jgi:citrate lyase subunit beta/citryl-CoA lyase
MKYPEIDLLKQRSTLAIPASTPKLFEKGLKSGVDAIFMDLEDSVAPPDKIKARENVIIALNELDWEGNDVRPMVRINGLDTQWMSRDVLDIIEQAGEFIDSFLVPMVGTPSDVYMVEAMINQLEQQEELENSIGIEVIIETALGMSNVEEIAKQGSLNGRLEALHFGVGDYAASTQSKTTSIGGIVDSYPFDQWHYAQARMTAAARAYGLRAIDGPYGDFKSNKGYQEALDRASALGMEGKWAIHPSQVPLANTHFSPTEEEIEYANAIIRVMVEAENQGKGSASLDGKLIDIASLKMANNILARI